MNERDIAEKMAAQTRYENQAKSSGQALRADCAEPAREGMTDNLRSRLNRAQRESRKAEQLSELLYLLDKNPEVARILELVEAVGRDY